MAPARGNFRRDSGIATGFTVRDSAPVQPVEPLSAMRTVAAPMTPMHVPMVAMAPPMSTAPMRTMMAPAAAAPATITAMDGLLISEASVAAMVRTVAMAGGHAGAERQDEAKR